MNKPVTCGAFGLIIKIGHMHTIMSAHLHRMQTSITMAATIASRTSPEGRAAVSRACDRSGETLSSEPDTESLDSVISLAPVLEIDYTYVYKGIKHM